MVHLVSDLLAGLITIIFTRTVVEAQRIACLLRALGLSAIPIHGQLSQSHRLGALAKFRAKSRKILVATDVAARGLDIPNVDCVVNYDLPDDGKTYIHRVGRTARAGKAGRAISLVTQYSSHIWLQIEHALQRKIPIPVVKHEVMVLKDRVDEALVKAKQAVRDHMEKGAGPRKKKNRNFREKREPGNMKDSEEG